MPRCEEVILNRICRKKIPANDGYTWCLEYSVIDDCGEVYRYSYISLDMKWMKPSLGGGSKSWHSLYYDELIERMRFRRYDDGEVQVHEFVIEMVNNIATEVALMGITQVRKKYNGRVKD